MVRRPVSVLKVVESTVKNVDFFSFFSRFFRFFVNETTLQSTFNKLQLNPMAISFMFEFTILS
jgi:hypothetical protein